MSKTNCWEFKKCGMEFNGRSVGKLMGCTASLEKRLDGIHDGMNGGRACWIVAGSMYGGERHGSFAQKHHKCQKCDFYGMVKKEEGEMMERTITLLQKIS